jgi:hypothetical protein
MHGVVLGSVKGGGVREEGEGVSFEEVGEGQ